MIPSRTFTPPAFSPSGPGWSAEYRSGTPAPLRFSLPEIDAVLHVAGARIDDLGEPLAELRKCRAHRFLEVPGSRGEMLSVLPFGTEPRFSRRWTLFGRMAHVITEIRTHPATTGQTFAVEEMLATGDWRRGEWFAFDPTSGQTVRTEFIWPETDTIVMESPLPPLTVVLENAVGGRLELGTGEDWWRWQAPPERFGGSARYRLRRTEGGATLERIVLEFPEPTPLPSRTWRFGSYFAWHPGTVIPLPPTQPAVPLPSPDSLSRTVPGQSVFTLSPEGWPDSALSMGNKGDAPRLCLLAPPVRNALRRWVRAHIGVPDGPDTLCLVGVNPGVCSAAAHLERPQRGVLHHWDLPDLFDFHSWANRQLLPRGRRLLIFPTQGEIFSHLPALLGMGNPVATEAPAGEDG